MTDEPYQIDILPSENIEVSFDDTERHVASVRDKKKEPSDKNQNEAEFEPNVEPRPIATIRDIDASDNLVTVHEAVEIFRDAGLPRNIRTIQRYCSPQKKGRALDCFETPTENGVRYMIKKSSILRFIEDAGAQVPTGGEQPQETPKNHEPLIPAINVDDRSIYEHPYVKRLEIEIEKKDAENEKLREDYRNDMKENATLMKELVQAATVAGSETLANFLLKSEGHVTDPETLRTDTQAKT